MSLESRKGMYASERPPAALPSALMQLASASSDRLMFAPSRIFCPMLPVGMLQARRTVTSESGLRKGDGYIRSAVTSGGWFYGWEGVANAF